MKSNTIVDKNPSSNRLIMMAIIVVILAIIVIGLTIYYLDENKKYTFINVQRSHIIATEVAIFFVIAIELIGTALIRRVSHTQIRNVGISVRAILRVFGYIILSVTIVSILAADASLAISVGTIMGIIIGFSTQSTIGNAIAGMFLAVGRSVRIGEEITIMGNTGKVVEIGSLFVVLKAESDTILIPNTAMLANPIRKKNTDVPQNTAYQQHEPNVEVSPPLIPHSHIEDSI
jgi:small-conductance mechanosensitive channel